MFAMASVPNNELLGGRGVDAMYVWRGIRNGIDEYGFSVQCLPDQRFHLGCTWSMVSLKQTR